MKLQQKCLLVLFEEFFGYLFQVFLGLLLDDVFDLFHDVVHLIETILLSQLQVLPELVTTLLVLDDLADSE